MATQTGLAGRLAQPFINSKITPLLMAAFLGIGIYSVWLTPKEEDPQIEVPMVDILVQQPGATPDEVESRIVEPLERLLSNIDGVEYVYSNAMQGQAAVSVRYYVGEDIPRSLVKLYEQILKRMEQMPPGASMPLIKTRAVNDVPILSLTLHSDTYSDYELHQMGTELASELQRADGVAAIDVIGGRERTVKVRTDPNQLMAYNLDLPAIAEQVQAANSQQQSGSFRSGDAEYLVETGKFLETAEDVRNLVVGVHEGQPVYLRDVATVTDGPGETERYVQFGYGAHHRPATADESDEAGDAGVTEALATSPAVTLALAKRDGADAMSVAEEALATLEETRSTLLPSDVTVTPTRNYGASASDKVSELFLHLIIAILTVTVVVGLSMGWRGGLVVFLSVPISFALTLFVYYMFGYTLNRITLFALIFVTGIVVDDSIIVAENMERHFKMRRLPFAQAAIAAINEVGNPTILATFTVIAAVLPMAFVSGLMGPYMSPMPIGASLAALFSLFVGLTITPYLAYRLLDTSPADENTPDYSLEDTTIYRWYAASIRPLLENRTLGWSFIGGTTVLLLASLSLFYFQAVTVKMLPYDDKDEFQVVIDMPEGTPLERTSAVTRELGLYLAQRPEVVDYQTYVGDASPINLNGLVRGYDMRSAPHQADIQVNLRSSDERDIQSHPIAKAMRPDMQAIGARYGANIKVAEVPPGPPVRATLVAEIYGPDTEQQHAIAEQVKTLFAETDEVVDVDWTVQADQTRYTFAVDKDKAMQMGVPAQRIAEAMRMGLNGADMSTLRVSGADDLVGIEVRLGEAERSSLDALRNMPVQTQAGTTVPVGDLVQINERTRRQHISRKDQQRVVYVTADVAGEVESPVYSMLDIEERLDEVEMPAGYDLSTLYTGPPTVDDAYFLKWGGEWTITYKVFRDLGIAFAVVLLIIYMLIVGWFQTLTTPIVMMVAIPLSLIGIVIGHWVMGAFFTATSMIGFIALAGIMVRNSVLLIDFIDIRLDDGAPLKQAVIEAGAVRTRPILLTAGTVAIGAFVIILDPVFQGLAISLIGGVIASTALTLLIVPLIYYMLERRKAPENRGRDGAAASGAAPASASGSASDHDSTGTDTTTGADDANGADAEDADDTASDDDSPSAST
ncbi:MAG: efflux RND transporter permease subunit [Longimonas sp.]|uniref:efflux RND transporter permease subunit n=1 Tax=Longimonas sp. TaxID=2039626 RepID=UPI003975E96E